MIVKFDASKPFKWSDIDSEGSIAKCFFCGKNANSQIFYYGYDNGNCICLECKEAIKGIFKDYLLIKANFDESRLSEILENFRDETIAQLKSHSAFRGFKYCREVEIVDDFEDTYTLEEIQQSNVFYSLKYSYCYNQMIRYMEKTFHEAPIIVRFFTTPDYYDESEEYPTGSDTVCGIAKIYNNGTTVIFGDMEIVLKNSKYSNDYYGFETQECIE